MKNTNLVNQCHNSTFWVTFRYNTSMTWVNHDQRPTAFFRGVNHDDSCLKGWGTNLYVVQNI